MSTLPHWPYPATFAHRGAGKLAPENTLAAFRVGYDHGYRAFEFDVKLSADGQAFLLHDDTLDRTTDGVGRADAFTLGELVQRDAGRWHSPRYAGEALPCFAGIARYVQDNACFANVEIKPMPGRERETGAAVALDAMHLWRNHKILPLISSFSEVALAAARESAPELPRALLLDTLPADWLARLERLGCVALDANHRVLDRSLIRQAQQAGFRVLCYTVNDPARAQDLFDWGIDSLITDAIDQIMPRPAQAD